MLKVLSRAGIAFALIFPILSHAQTSPPELKLKLEVKWEVKNRFPLFRSEKALKDVLKLKSGQTLRSWADAELAKNSDLLLGFTKPYTSRDDFKCTKQAAAMEFPTLWNPCTEKYDSALFVKGKYAVVVELPTRPAGRCKFKAGNFEVLASCSDEVDFEIPLPDVAYDLTVESEDGVVLAKDVIKIQDVLLVAFGDSFSSGESNPDVPALHTEDVSALSPRERDDGVFWIEKKEMVTRPSAWLDKRCHRSVFSWPILSAARLAIENPHMVVRAASWACTGAEITDGFFSAQLSGVNQSQFMAARTALCTKETGSGKPFFPVVLNGKTSGKKGGRTLGCLPSDLKIPIDAAMFTFGGNDVYFAPVIADAIAITGFSKFYWKPLELLLKPYRKGAVKTPWDANARIKGDVGTYDNLPVRYKSLNDGFKALGIPSNRVFQVQYPNPLRDQHDRLCFASPYNGMEVLKKTLKTVNTTTGESKNAESLLILPLQDAVNKNRGYDWIIVDGKPEGGQANDRPFKEIVEHGLCAFGDDRAKEFAIPQLKGGEWSNNYKSSDYKHYSTTKRWFRTPDDVAMGMHEGNRLFPIEGAFHPSAIAHAFIADEVYLQLSKALVKP